MVQLFWKKYGGSLKIKNKVPYDPPIPLLGTYPKEIKSISLRDISTPIFTAVLFTIVKRKLSIDDK